MLLLEYFTQIHKPKDNVCCVLSNYGGNSLRRSNQTSQLLILASKQMIPSQLGDVIFQTFTGSATESLISQMCLI